MGLLTGPHLHDSVSRTGSYLRRTAFEAMPGSFSCVGFLLFWFAFAANGENRHNEERSGLLTRCCLVMKPP